MNTRKFFSAIFLALCLITAAVAVHAQTTNAAQTANTSQAESNNDETNLDTQLYLIVGTNQNIDDSRLPPSLDPVVKQLRASLPFKNYRLAATLLNRVKNEGRLDLSWIGGPMAASGPALPGAPSFSQFKVRQVRIVRNAEGQQVVQMLGFNFGARIPLQPGPVAGAGVPVPHNYENTGLATDISMRESEPVIVGTLNVGPSGDAIILVVSVKRTQR